VTFPDKARLGFEVSPVAKDLIKRLLEKDKAKRLGAADDVREILAHPFFAGLDLEKLLRKEIEPPYKPVVGDDLKFFDQKLTAMSGDMIAESVIDKSRVKLIQQN
jgi:serine/threonine protein kinase